MVHSQLLPKSSKYWVRNCNFFKMGKKLLNELYIFYNSFCFISFQRNTVFMNQQFVLQIFSMRAQRFGKINELYWTFGIFFLNFIKLSTMFVTLNRYYPFAIFFALKQVSENDILLLFLLLFSYVKNREPQNRQKIKNILGLITLKHHSIFTSW